MKAFELSPVSEIGFMFTDREGRKAIITGKYSWMVVVDKTMYYFETKEEAHNFVDKTLVR